LLGFFFGFAADDPASWSRLDFLIVHPLPMILAKWCCLFFEKKKWKWRGRVVVDGKQMTMPLKMMGA
jgi:hypothetical protein